VRHDTPVEEEKNTCMVSLVVAAVNYNGREEEESTPVVVGNGSSMVSLVVVESDSGV
jgi:hypothetical protein